MKLRSCVIRYLRYFFINLLCSSLTLFINSDMLINRFRVQLVATVIFLIVCMADAYKFGEYFGKQKHLKYGVVYPYAGFLLTSYICHFMIKTSRFKYLFLPFCVFGYYDIPRLASLTLVHIIICVFMALCLYMGRKKFYKNI